jgi:hypothetical protein
MDRLHRRQARGRAEPAEITGFGFFFTWGGSTDTAYEVDVTIDDLSFIE